MAEESDLLRLTCTTALPHDPLPQHLMLVAAAVLISGVSLGQDFARLKSEDNDKAMWRSSSVALLPLAGTSAVNRWDIVRSVPPGPMLKQQVNIDSILQAMLASNYGVSPASLLSLRPASRWVSCDILRDSGNTTSKAHPNYSSWLVGSIAKPARVPGLACDGSALERFYAIRNRETIRA